MLMWAITGDKSRAGTGGTGGLFLKAGNWFLAASQNPSTLKHAAIKVFLLKCSSDFVGEYGEWINGSTKVWGGEMEFWDYFPWN